MKTSETCDYFEKLNQITFVKFRNCFDKELPKEKL